MKKLSFLLALLLLLQSCSVYHSESVPVQEAVAADEKVKVITADEQEYKFKRLELADDRPIGIAKLNSDTAIKLSGRPAKIDGKYLKVDLSDLDIKEIRLRNKFHSTASTVVVIAVSAILAFLTVFFISFSQADIWPEGTDSE